MNGNGKTAKGFEEPARRGAVVVTGASSGIGRACALKLARSGFDVFAGVRKEKDAQALRDTASEGSLTPLILDVTDPDLLVSSLKTVEESVGEDGLAGLVNNAGVGVAWPLEVVPVDELRRQFEVNVFGQLAVTQTFSPLVCEAGGRIVNIGSVGGWITVPFGGPLCASKHALRSMNDALRMELYPWGVHVILIEPASISTSAVDKLEADVEANVGRFPEPGRARYADAYRTVSTRAIARERAGSPPEVVADAVLRSLSARKPKTRYLVGADARPLATLPRILPDRLLDRVRFRALGLRGTFGERRNDDRRETLLTRPAAMRG